MNQDTKDMLNILAAEDGPVNGTLLKHRRTEWSHRAHMLRADVVVARGST